MAHTILVIGATGFIGSHTIRRFISKGYIVYATHLPDESFVNIPGVRWIACDITKPDFIYVLPERCDSIVYLAQSQHWRRFPDEVRDVFQVNVDAPLRMAEYALQIGSQRLIYSSTGSIYSQTQQPAHENEPLYLDTKRNFYVASKLAAESILRPYAEIFNVIVLRLFFPYGAGQHTEMLIPQLIRRVRERRSIELHGTDGMLINPIFIADVTEVLERCLSLNTTVTLNVAGPEVLTLREIGIHIGRELGMETCFIMQPDLSPPIIVGDTQELRSRLGWEPKTNFEQGLQLWAGSEPGIFKTPSKLCFV